MGWTTEKIALLEKLWAAGRTQSECAARLGVTRSTVAGKIDRLGLPSRGDKKVIVRARRARAEPQGFQKPKQFARPPVFAACPVAAATEPIIPVGARHGLLTRGANHRVMANDAVTERTCRWPIGDPKHHDFHFCNTARVPGQSYCEPHCRRAFRQPAEIDRPEIGPVSTKPARVLETT